MRLKRKRPPLSKWQVRFCRTVMYLNYIPKYGRYYTYLAEESKEAGELVLSKAHWTWQKRGLWGIYLLDDLGLMWAYLDTVSPWEDCQSGNGSAC
jgi:hypothetical protein